MNYSADVPPAGTVRDWLDYRATQGGTAIVFPEDGSSLDWAALRDNARAIAADLTKRGIARGESVAVVHPNSRDGVTALFGSLYGGFRVTMINLAAGQDAIAYALEHSEARVAYVHDSALELFSGATRPCLTAIPLPETLEEVELHPLSAEDHALLMYTSGTTGRPKGVVHTHASLLAGGWTTTIAHALTPTDRGLCVLPIYHINGLCVTVISALISGGSLAMCSRFSTRNFWSYASQSKATWFSVVPTIISHLLHGDAEPDAETKARLRFGRSASSALSPEVQSAFETRFELPVIETMGLTETAAQILSNPLPPGTRKIGSPGIAFGNDVAILGSDLTPCPAEMEGEIVVRGPNVMLEYLKNPDATSASFTDGWLRTGDLGRKDADGYLFVTGRLKELIIKGGENIAPREIDEALYSHADVVEAAAFARPCATYGERVEAAVAVSVGSPLCADDLIDICVSKLGSFKAPDHIHFMRELPKGPSGKIQRRKLLELTQSAQEDEKA
ncbi:MAG: AMP-binding protein [Paracoccaceae bacterium]